jgi:peptidyl-prolyl cis-trans isomerase D
MLRLMRESAGSWIIKILLGLIVLAFVFVGTGTYNSGRASKIGTVNGNPITLNDYQTAYFQVLDNLRQQFGGQLNDEIIKMFNVQQQALDQVIETELMRQAAETAGIIVSNQELIESITRIPAFQEAGVFDKQRYQLLLSQNRMTPESFEAMQKEAILFSKLQSIIAGSVKVSEQEARAWYEWENATASIQYVPFEPAAFTDIEITDEMLAAYYDEHKQNYMTEPAVKARYIKFDPREFRENIVVSEQEIENYYHANPLEFEVEEMVSGRQIILRVPDELPGGADDEKRTEALALLERARAGEDFSELARQYSEGPEKESGGSFGPLPRTGMVPAVADAAFSLEVGEISDPVKTRYGWHIIKIEDRLPETIKPLADVADDIRARLAERKSHNIAYDEAVTIYNISFGDDDLVENAEELGLNLRETDFFTRSQGPADIPGASEFARIAFALSPMDISDVIDIGGIYYLIQVIAEQPEQIPELETVREQVQKDLMVQQQRLAAEEAAGELLTAAGDAGSLSAAADEKGYRIRGAKIENRNKPPEELAAAPSVISTAYELSQDNPLPGTVIFGNDGKYYVLELTGKTPPPAAGFSIARDNIVERLTRQKQNDIFQSWITRLRENSRITISEQFRI